MRVRTTQIQSQCTQMHPQRPHTDAFPERAHCAPEPRRCIPIARRRTRPDPRPERTAPARKDRSKTRWGGARLRRDTKKTPDLHTPLRNLDGPVQKKNEAETANINSVEIRIIGIMKFVWTRPSKNKRRGVDLRRGVTRDRPAQAARAPHFLYHGHESRRGASRPRPAKGTRVRGI